MVEILTLVVTLIIGVATVTVAGVATRESFLLRQAATLPEVAVYLEAHPDVENAVHLVIRNVGNGPAHDIWFEQRIRPIPQPLPALADPIYILEAGLPYLAPGREMRFIIGEWGDEGEHAIGHGKFEVIARYYEHEWSRRFGDQPMRSTYLLDPRQYQGSSHFNNAERDAAKALTKAMTKLAANKVQITVKD